MPCPYAEKKGPIVFCKAIKKNVSPFSYPCLTKDKWKRCRHYREAEKRKALEKPAAQASQPEIPTPTPAATPVARSETTEPAQKVQVERREVRTKGIRLDGSPARHCLECIYYGSKTRTCLLLGVEVKDPYDPPCAKS